MLCDVDRDPQEMSEGDDEIRKWQDSRHGVCLQHMHRRPKPDAVNCHFLDYLDRVEGMTAVVRLMDESL